MSSQRLILLSVLFSTISAATVKGKVYCTKELTTDNTTTCGFFLNNPNVIVAIQPTKNGTIGEFSMEYTDQKSLFILCDCPGGEKWKYILLEPQNGTLDLGTVILGKEKIPPGMY